MPVVHIPASLRYLSGDRARIEVAGATLRQVFAALERECPGFSARIIDQDDLRTDMAVAIDGSILEGGGLSQSVRSDAEIYLVPPIGGGSDPPATGIPAVLCRLYARDTAVRAFDGGAGAP